MEKIKCNRKGETMEDKLFLKNHTISVCFAVVRAKQL